MPQTSNINGSTALNINVVGNNSISTDLEGVGEITIGSVATEITLTGITRTIIMSADTTNTGTIYVGKSGVLTDGSNHFAKLLGGDDLVIDYNDSSNAVYAVSTTGSEILNVGALL